MYYITVVDILLHELISQSVCNEICKVLDALWYMYIVSYE